MGRLPRDTRHADVEDFFKDGGFSKAVKEITLKTGFAFIVSLRQSNCLYFRRFLFILGKKST